MVMENYAPEGEREISKYSEAFLKEACENGTILEAKAIRCDSDFTLTVDLGCMPGEIPLEEIAYLPQGVPKPIASITRVGKNVAFKVNAFTVDKSGNTKALLSRKDAQRQACHFLFQKRPGDILSGKITHLERFGAFVDVGCGYIALLPIDCISVSRIEHPNQRFWVGMKICAVLKSNENGKLTLSHRELLGTWQENADLFSVGQTTIGRVRSIEPYGIFVELTPNLAGLAEVKEGVKVGQSASVFVKNIIPDRMKVKLVLVESFDDEEKILPYSYTQTEGHIDRWIYTPENCIKQIETVF